MIKTYAITFTRAAMKQMQKLPKKEQSAIAKKLEILAVDPKPEGSKSLKGAYAPLYRVRSGNYRVIYSIEDDQFIVLVVKVGHRKDIYR